MNIYIKTIVVFMDIDILYKYLQIGSKIKLDIYGENKN